MTTSPEYREGALNAWGADSSFQLSSVHRLNRNLLRAAKLLGKEPDPMWLKIAEKLPQVTLVGKPGEEAIDLLEVNTTPGMTATSFIPQQVRAAGLDIKDVLTDIVENQFA